MFGCTQLKGLAQYTAGGYYYDASGAPVYTGESTQTASQQQLIAQSEQPVYTANSAQLQAQNALIAQSEQPVQGRSPTGSLAPVTGTLTPGRAPGAPLISFSNAGGQPLATGLTPTQQAVAAGYTPTVWASMTPAQKASALQAAGYSTAGLPTASATAGASLFSSPAILLIGGLLLFAFASGGSKK